jgi:EAL domain-containing protein (putative c-di-GMP-specific phosphodiesterase class I)
MTFPGTTMNPAAAVRPAAVLNSIMTRRAIRTLFQPIVHLATETVVGFAAVSRGPLNSRLESPEALLAAARDVGRVGELDWLFRVSAMEAAGQSRLHPSLSWCINVEPAGLATECPPALRDAYGRWRNRLRGILEVTGREQPDGHTLLAACAAAHRDIWGLALDRVGPDEEALDLLPVLRPDVVKLDLSLLHRDPDAEIARITARVRAYTEQDGAVIIAEGIESREHVERAVRYGAEYGQGYLFGAPGPLPASVPPPRHPIPFRLH